MPFCRRKPRALSSYSERMSRGAARDRDGRRWRIWAVLVALLVLALGAVEDWYGRTDAGDLFGSDAVQYLDCARAMEHGDFRSALNPLWSQGYPALLAVTRPAFPSGMAGEWVAVRAVNWLVFCFCAASFAFLLAGFGPRRRDAVFWLGGVCVFLAALTCLGQVSRVGPDELVAGLFFLACGLLVRLIRRPRVGLAVLFGAVLGAGFLVKAVFLALGCSMLSALGVALWRKRRLMDVAVGAAVFGGMVLGYGALLSRAVGYPTLGEAGALNYAWHVDRLQKWVHWEGGVQSAGEAWPKPWIARFVRWESDPPDFGQPLHPSVMLGREPTVYSFHEAVQATYVPYYDPAYWYQGFRHVFRWRYQVIAVVKSLGDLARALFAQPMFYAVLAAYWVLRRVRTRNEGLVAVMVCAGIGVAIYLPVHLEGRYLSGFLAVLAVGVLARVSEASARARRGVLALMMLGLAAQMGEGQRGVWVRAARGWDYRENVQWKVAEGVERSGLPRGSEVGMVSWTPNLYCDWAYLAGVRITSEIANGNDEKAFWGMDAEGQRAVLERFRGAGARAVLSWEGPPGGVGEGWRRVGSTPMWMYRFD
jgi:hypothetical protein